METFIEIMPAAHMSTPYLLVFYSQDGKVLVKFNKLVTSTKKIFKHIQLIWWAINQKAKEKTVLLPVYPLWHLLS